MSDLLTVRNLTKSFALKAGLFARGEERVYALRGVDLTLPAGQTYGLVGESGSGKTTLARTLVQLEVPDSGTLEYRDANGEPWVVNPTDRRRLAAYRRDVKYVFQDPASSLDPRMTVGELLTLGSRYHTTPRDRHDLEARARAGLEAVGLRPSDAGRRPSEFSGGQRQRIALARALVTRPRLLLCDEVVSALDVSVRGQILELLLDLKRRFDLALVFIAHDLDVVAYMADRVGVFYGGLLMEEADAREISRRPLHPYTKLLYESAPGGKLSLAPAPMAATPRPQGCPFQPRCPLAVDRCRAEVPSLRVTGVPGAEGVRKVACHQVG